MIKITKSTSSGYTLYKNHRTEPYFTYVQQGKKTIEGRVRKGCYRLVKQDDHIVIYNEEETKNFEVLVKRVSIYKSFREMFSKEYLRKILPDAKNVNDGVKIYRRFYSEEQENRFGVVAIEVEKID